MGAIPGQMQAKCIDYGQNFLTGQATSVIAATGIDIEAGNLKQLADAVQDKTMSMVSDLKNTATKEVTKIGSQIGGMAGSLVGAGLSAMQGAFQTADVAKQAVGELTTYGVQLTAKIGTNIASMIAAFPAQVTKKATAIASEQCKEELQQRLKEVMGTPAEEHAQKEAEKEKENKTKKAIAWCKKAVKDANEFKDKTLSMVSDLKSTATKEVTKVGSQIGGMAGSLVGAGLAAIQGAFQTIDVAKQAVGELTTYGVQIIGKAAKQIAGMVVAFPVEVAKEATSIAAEQCKEELQQRLKEMMGTPAEEHAQKEAEKEKTNKIKKTIAWCNKAIKDVNEFKDKTLSAIQKDCEDISALMIQGPGWVNDQIGSAIDSAKTYMSDYADSKMKNVKMHYDEAVNNSAKAAASTLKKKLIDPTLEKAKDQFDNLGTSLNKTKQKAKTAIQKQLFKLAGKLGISPNG